MAQVAVRVRDPAGEYWAQLVDPVAVAAEVAREVAGRIGLPPKLHYELVPEGSAVPLPAGQSLRDAGIIAGSTLVLRPVRDGFFAEFTRELYEEALQSALEEAWDEARAQLEELYRVDPGHPDKHQLWKKVNGGKEPPAAAAATASVPLSTPSAAETIARSAAATTVVHAAPKGVAGTFVAAFFTLVVLAVGGGAALVYFEQVPRPEWLPDWFPTRSAAASGPTTLVNGVAVGTGDVRVTLTWDTGADLDLYVTDPRGEEIYFGHRTSASGGELDVDANAGCTSGSRVENVFWPTAGAPTGTYRVSITPYSDCGFGPASYQVAIYVNGVLVNRHAGTISTATGAARLPDFRR